MRCNYGLQYMLADWRVLIVDESVPSRKILARVLKELGFEWIVEASCGQEALMALDLNNRFDLVISDWEMFDMSGIELLETVRGIDSFLPFLMVAIHCGEEEVMRAIEAGVTDFIIKPYAPSTIETKIEAIANRKKKRSLLGRAEAEKADNRHKDRLMRSMQMP